MEIYNEEIITYSVNLNSTKRIKLETTKRYFKIPDKNYYYPMTNSKFLELSSIWFKYATTFEKNMYITTDYILNVVCNDLYITIILLHKNYFTNKIHLKLIEKFYNKYSNRYPIVLHINNFYHLFGIIDSFFIVDNNIKIYQYKPFNILELFARNKYYGEKPNYFINFYIFDIEIKKNDFI